MNRLNAQTRAYILHCLCEGMSQRSCERIFRVSNKTVAKLFEEAGDMAIVHVASLRDLTPKRIQADEIHSFVAAKHQSDRISHEEAGTVWAYLAMCAETKLIFAYHLGDRGFEDATIFAKGVAAKLKRTDRGELVVRPTIITDGLHAYEEAFDNAFGSDADRAVVIKRYSNVDRDGRPSKRERYVGADRVTRVGKVHTADIHTSYIERQNGNLRMGNRRYNRRTNAFSKTLLNHERHLALWIMYHNLCWVPRPGRPRRDEKGERSNQWVKKLPAGIAAGVTDHLWEIEDLLALTDEFISQRNQLSGPEDHVERAESRVEEANAKRPPYWVFHHLAHRATKVHLATCSNCRDGRGKRDGVNRTGEWFPFKSKEDAIAAAKQLQPDRNSVCNMCMGEYRKLGYRHANSSRQTPRGG